MSYITTHVLDTSTGRPAGGIGVGLEVRGSLGQWREIGRGVTAADGRLRALGPDTPQAGVYRLTFDTGGYFDAQGVKSFYPEAAIVFQTVDGQDHYHVPLLLNPFGYTTYRGT
jgi:5-hydroxyisourate hydrolase